MFKRFFNQKIVTKANPVGAILMMGSGTPNFMGSDPKTLAREGYQTNAVVYSAVKKIATGLASIDLKVVTEDEDGKQTEQPDSDLQALIDRPNPLQSGNSFLGDVASDLEIFGETFIIRAPSAAIQASVSSPKELWVIRPDRVEVKPGKTGMPTAYIVKGEKGKLSFPVDDEGRSDILHMKFYNPTNVWRGLSPMTAAANSVDIFNKGNRWNMSLLDNGARPSGIITIEDSDENQESVSEENLARLSEQIDTSYSGPLNSGRPWVFSGGMTWTELQMSPKDMDYKENLLIAARWIASVYGVPPQLINIPGESTFNNLAEAKLSLFQETIIPLLRFILDEFNVWLSPQFNENLKIVFDEDSIPALAIRRRAKLEALEKVSFMTLNEKRERAGLEPREGGDTILVDSNKIPLSIVGFDNDSDDMDKEQYIEFLIKNGRTKEEALKEAKEAYGNEERFTSD